MNGALHPPGWLAGVSVGDDDVAVGLVLGRASGSALGEAVVTAKSPAGSGACVLVEVGCVAGVSMGSSVATSVGPLLEHAAANSVAKARIASARTAPMVSRRRAAVMAPGPNWTPSALGPRYPGEP